MLKYAVETNTNDYYANLYLTVARQLGISTEVIHSKGLIRLFNSHREQLFYKAIPQVNSAVSAEICQHKNLTTTLLRANHIPTPHQLVISQADQLDSLVNVLPNPSVIKPAVGIGGQDVYANIKTPNEAILIINTLLNKHKKVLVESFETGNDYRLLVLYDQVIGVVQKTPPHITGNGINNIRSLISSSPSSKRIPLDDSLLSQLKQSGYTLKKVLENGKTLMLRSNANYSTGGVSKTLNNNQIHPQIIKLAIEAAKCVYTHLAGVDILIKNRHQPPKNNAVVLEVNHNPGFKMHYHPDIGNRQDVVTTILNTLFNL